MRRIWQTCSSTRSLLDLVGKHGSGAPGLIGGSLANAVKERYDGGGYGEQPGRGNRSRRLPERPNQRPLDSSYVGFPGPSGRSRARLSPRRRYNAASCCRCT